MTASFVVDDNCYSDTWHFDLLVYLHLLLEAVTSSSQLYSLLAPLCCPSLV